MDFISPIQHNTAIWYPLMRPLTWSPRALRSQLPDSSIGRWWQRLHPEQERQPNDSSSGTRAVYWLIAFNLPAPAVLYTTLWHAVRTAETNWSRSFQARWLPSFTPWLAQQKLLRTHNACAKALEPFLRTWTLSPTTWGEKRWWTWITSAFVHAAPAHFIGNMTSLLGFGQICAKLPGMTALHIWAIAIGSAVASSAALLLDKTYVSPEPWGYAFGASGVVSAFGVIAALGAPAERVSFKFWFFDISASPWKTMAFSVISDLVGTFARPSKTAPQQGQRVGYSAHLGGAAFGLLYYLLVLRSAAVEAAEDMSEAPVQPDTSVDVGAPCTRMDFKNLDENESSTLQAQHGESEATPGAQHQDQSAP